MHLNQKLPTLISFWKVFAFACTYLLVVFIVLSFSSLHILENTTATYSHLLDKSHENVVRFSKIALSLKSAEDFFEDVLSGSKKYVGPLTILYDKATNELTEIIPYVDVSKRSHVERLIKNIKKLKGITRAALHLYMDDVTGSSGHSIFTKKARLINAESRKQLYQVILILSNQVNNNSIRAAEYNKRSIYKLSLIVICIVLISIPILYLCCRWLILYLKHVEVGIKEVIRSNYNHKLNIDTDDIFGRIAKSFDLMVNKLRKTTKELSEEKSNAVVASKVKSNFIATMSHEIRTPLNSIVGLSELLGTKDTSKEVKEIANRIKISSMILYELICNILDFTKIEEGKDSIENIQFSFREIILDMSNLFYQGMESKGILFSVNIDDNTPDQMISDPQKIKQVLINLLSNAMKFTSKGSIKVNVCSNYDNEVSIEVTDTGVGISPDKQEQVFDSFTQEDSSVSRKFGGTGLGLTISKKIAKLLRGDISLKSEIGTGSSFIFKFKFINSDEKMQFVQNELVFYNKDICNYIVSAFDIQKSQYIIKKSLNDVSSNAKSIFVECQALKRCSSASILMDKRLVVVCCNKESCPFQNTLPLSMRKTIVRHNNIFDDSSFVCNTVRNSRVNASTSRTKNILIIDDSEDNLYFMKKIFEKSKHKLEVCLNGQDGIKKASAKFFDCIFVDIQMPEMDGWEVVSKIRSDDSTSKSKESVIIALSADTQSNSVERSLKVGFDFHLGKPIKQDAIFAFLD